MNNTPEFERFLNDTGTTLELLSSDVVSTIDLLFLVIKLVIFLTNYPPIITLVGVVPFFWQCCESFSKSFPRYTGIWKLFFLQLSQVAQYFYNSTLFQVTATTASVGAAAVCTYLYLGASVKSIVQSIVEFYTGVVVVKKVGRITYMISETIITYKKWWRG